MKMPERSRTSRISHIVDLFPPNPFLLWIERRAQIHRSDGLAMRALTHIHRHTHGSDSVTLTADEGGENFGI